MKEENNKKVYDFIKGNIINAVIILTALIYIAWGLITLKRTDLTVAEVLAKGGIGIVVAFIIKECMGENGFNYGYRSEIWKENKDQYLKVCNSANEHIELVDNFYACEEIEKKKRYRRQNLVAAQMRYEWFFDKNGNYTNPKISTKKDEKSKDVLILTKYQIRVLKRCLNVKIYNLNLFSEYGIEVESDTKKEKTDKNQRRKMLSKNALFGVVGAVVGAYFLPSLADFDVALLIESSIQVAMWIGLGAMQLYTNFNYVVVEKVAKLKRKSELIVKFKKGCEDGLYKTNPYDGMEVEANEQSEIGSISIDSVRSSSLSNN